MGNTDSDTADGLSHKEDAAVYEAVRGAAGAQQRRSDGMQTADGGRAIGLQLIPRVAGGGASPAVSDVPHDNDHCKVYRLSHFGAILSLPLFPHTSQNCNSCLQWKKECCYCLRTTEAAEETLPPLSKVPLAGH